MQKYHGRVWIDSHNKIARNEDVHDIPYACLMG